jgi:hypothetical protein
LAAFFKAVRQKVGRKEELGWANLVDPLRTAVLEAVPPKIPF